MYIVFIWQLQGSPLFTFFCFLFFKQMQNGEPTKLRLQRKQMETSSQSDRRHIKASPKNTLTAIIVCHALYNAYVNTTSFKFTVPRICCGSHLMK